MTDISAAQPHAFSPPFSYTYPQASPCGALIIYCRSKDDFLVLTSQRADLPDDRVIGKRNHAAGGFYEVKDMFKQVSAVQDGDAELYREMTEELGEGITDIIPYAAFKRRREYLWDGMTRVRDTHFVHMQVHKMLEVSPRELFQILALPGTQERVGFKVERFKMGSEIADKDSYVRGKLHDFLYPTEVDLAVKWYDVMQERAHEQQQRYVINF